MCAIGSQTLLSSDIHFSPTVYQYLHDQTWTLSKTKTNNLYSYYHVYKSHSLRTLINTIIVLNQLHVVSVNMFLKRKDTPTVQVYDISKI